MTTDPATPPTQAPKKTFTGRARRSTRTSVKVIDRLMKYVITVGGIGVTIFFATIVGFLFYVVVPLFRAPAVNQIITTELPAAASSATGPAARPVAMEVDEFIKSFWVLDSNAQFATYRTGGGELIASKALAKGAVTALASTRGKIAIGAPDGTVQLGQIKQETQFISELPDSMNGLKPEEAVAYQDGIAILTPSGQARVVRFASEMGDPLDITDGKPSAVDLVDYFADERAEGFVAFLNDGRLIFNVVSKTTNVMTGAVRREVSKYTLPRHATAPVGKPFALMLGLNARAVYVIYPDGTLIRYNTDDAAKAYIAEVVDVLPDADANVSAVRMLNGDTTLIIADSKGGVSGWFAAPFKAGIDPNTPDRVHMVKAHTLRPQSAAVVAIASSSRDRQFVTADAKGHVVLRHMTSGTDQAEQNVAGGRAVELLAIAPKGDAIIALDSTRNLTAWSLDNPHADGSMKALFFPVHYEGYAEPIHVWQSSAGTDAAEPKMSLVPLIFGTIKATFYALLFAVPIAILAAIYSSEFMQPQVRSVIKPVVEMMASLPSVVLGFIAALVLAPFLENVLPAVLMLFIAVPIGVMLFGFLWQALPPHITRAMPRALTFVIMVIVVFTSAWLCFIAGPVLERVLFYGDFKGWVGKRIGNGVPGWVILLTPIFTVILSLIFNLYIRRMIPFYRDASGGRVATVLIDLGRFAITAFIALSIALTLGTIFNFFGWDLRGEWTILGGQWAPIGGYVQRNTLIVGMVMGFAIIPIIYTVSEDALSSVPSSLRSAALGAGATPWQTAIRVVLPVAVSGIFSACMIGFGRAAGETMIVLMAGGNTALLDLNMFNGIRPLSANIAVELPEAPVNSTHYRVLFLSALVLFAMTFVVNTVAEIVRLRFRKRAYQL